MLLAVQAAAQPVTQHKTFADAELTLTLDHQSVGVAEELRLTLAVEAPAGANVMFQPVADTLGPFRVSGRHPLGPLPLAERRQRWQRDYVLVPEQAGNLMLPAMAVDIGAAQAEVASSSARGGCAAPDCKDRSATQREAKPPLQLSSDPVAITVTSVVPADADNTEPKDIVGPLDLPVPPRAWWQNITWWWPVAGLGLALLGAWRWWRRPISVTPEPARSAHELALDALAQLQAQDFIGQGRIDDYYVGLSAIVRGYLAARFHLHAPQQTTEEFLHSVQADSAIGVRRDLLGAFLSQCDLVKFARHRPAPEVMRAALARAREFIEQTAEGSA